MQFKVPQNIDMQDKIIGPLTLGQFFYLLFGGLIIYILFSKLVLTGYSFLFWVLAIPIGLVSFALAFVKVQDRPFPVFMLALVKYSQLPRARVWQHYWAPVSSAKPKTEVKETKKVRKQIDIAKVSELAQVLDEPLPREGDER